MAKCVVPEYIDPTSKSVQLNLLGERVLGNCSTGMSLAVTQVTYTKRLIRPGVMNSKGGNVEAEEGEEGGRR